MEILAQASQEIASTDGGYWTLAEENALLRKEIQVARKAAELTANLVVKQFEETEKVLHRFQVANAQRKAVLDKLSRQKRLVKMPEGEKNGETNPVGKIAVTERHGNLRMRGSGRLLHIVGR